MTRADDCGRLPLPIRKGVVGGRRAAFLLTILILLLLGCDLRMKPAVPEMTTPSPDAGRIAVSPDDLDDASLEKALAASLRYYQSLPPSAEYPLGKRRVSVRELQDSLLAFRGIILSRKTWQDRECEIRRVFDFVPSEGADGTGAVLFTGCFEPVLEGSPARTERFRYPLYGTPPDAVTVNLGKFSGSWRGKRIVGRLEKKELESRLFQNFEDRFQYPLALAILFLVAALWIGERRKPGGTWLGRYRLSRQPTLGTRQ